MYIKGLKLTGEKKLLKTRVFSVVEKAYKTKRNIMVRTIIKHNGSVAILPVLEKDKIVLLKQYRHTFDRFIYEVPAGTLENCESPKRCAIRELEEETGYRAKKLIKTISIYIAPGYTTEILTIFIATDLYKGNFSPEKYENITPIVIPIEKALAYIENGTICDSKTITSILYYIQFLKN